MLIPVDLRSKHANNFWVVHVSSSAKVAHWQVRQVIDHGVLFELMRGAQSPKAEETESSLDVLLVDLRLSQVSWTCGMGSDSGLGLSG